LSRNGQWQGWNELRGRLNPSMDATAIDEALRSGAPGQAGYRMKGRDLLAEIDGELIDEVSLHRVDRSGALTNPVDAVYQSRSADGACTGAPR
jgi:hypothetical protein